VKDYDGRDDLNTEGGGGHSIKKTHQRTEKKPAGNYIQKRK